MNSKKAISPVVAMSLLLVVAVIAVVGFQEWFSNFSSVVFSDVEIKSDVAYKNIEILTLIDNKLYITNNINNNLEINSIKIDKNECIFKNNLTFGVNEITLFGCLSNISDGAHDVVIVTNSIILEKRVTLDDLKSSYNPELIITLSNTLLETNLNSSSINMKLNNDFFYDSTFNISNFVLNNAPIGLDIENISYVSDTEINLNFQFDGTDFDIDISNFNILIDKSEFLINEDILTEDINITGIIEIPVPLDLSSITCVASDTYTTNFCGNMFDQNDSTFWSSGDGDTGIVTVDLGSEKYIHNISTLVIYYITGTPNTKTIGISLSNNNIAWTQIVAPGSFSFRATDNSIVNHWETSPLINDTARYVRFTVDDSFHWTHMQSTNIIGFE